MTAKSRPQGMSRPWRVLSCKQNEKRTSIRMREWRRMRAEWRVWPDRSCESGDRRGPARGRVFWRSRSVDRKRGLYPDEEPQLARPPHHRLPDEAVYEFPPNRDADRCCGQGRVQRRHRLSYRTGSSAAVAKESAARSPTARSLLDLVGPATVFDFRRQRARGCAHALPEGKCWAVDANAVAVKRVPRGCGDDQSRSVC